MLRRPGLFSTKSFFFASMMFLVGAGEGAKTRELAYRDRAVNETQLAAAVAMLSYILADSNLETLSYGMMYCLGFLASRYVMEESEILRMTEDNFLEPSIPKLFKKS